jgi:hypothetical protein
MVEAGAEQVEPPSPPAAPSDPLYPALRYNKDNTWVCGIKGGADVRNNRCSPEKGNVKQEKRSRMRSVAEQKQFWEEISRKGRGKG